MTNNIYSRLKALDKTRKDPKAPLNTSAQIDESYRVRKVLELTEQLKRNPMPWEREALEKQLAWWVRQGQGAKAQD